MRYVYMLTLGYILNQAYTNSALKNGTNGVFTLFAILTLWYTASKIHCR